MSVYMFVRMCCIVCVCAQTYKNYIGAYGAADPERPRSSTLLFGVKMSYSQSAIRMFVMYIVVYISLSLSLSLYIYIIYIYIFLFIYLFISVGRTAGARYEGSAFEKRPCRWGRGGEGPLEEGPPLIWTFRGPLLKPHHYMLV